MPSRTQECPAKFFSRERRSLSSDGVGEGSDAVDFDTDGAVGLREPVSGPYRVRDYRKGTLTLFAAPRKRAECPARLRPTTGARA